MERRPRDQIEENREGHEQGAGSDTARRQGRAYQAVMEAVFAIPIASAIGWFADSKLGSSPIGVLLGLGFGFATFIVLLARMRGMVESEAAKAERDPNTTKATWEEWDERERDE